LIAQIPQLFASDIECGTSKDNCIARIVGQPAGETINGWINYEQSMHQSFAVLFAYHSFALLVESH